MHNMEKCGWGTGRPPGCSLRSHRRRRLAPLPPPFLPAPMLRHVVYASLLHFGVETAYQKTRRPIKLGHHAKRAEVYFDEKGCVCRRDLGAPGTTTASIPIED